MARSVYRDRVILVLLVGEGCMAALVVGGRQTVSGPDGEGLACGRRQGHRTSSRSMHHVAREYSELEYATGDRQWHTKSGECVDIVEATGC